MLILLYTIFSSCAVSAFLPNENEFKISFELSKKLNVDFCIFVEDREHINFNVKAMKKFFPSPSTFLTYDRIFDFIQEQNKIYFRVMFILKEKNSSAIEDFLQKLKKSEHNVCRHSWLAFLENENQINDLSIPYDCQFLFAQLNKNDDNIAYNLMEMYKANNKFFYLPFGKWDKNGSLKINEAYIYLRRRDLNQTKVQLRFHQHDEHENFLQQLCDEIWHSISNIMNFKFELAELHHQKARSDFVRRLPIFLVADSVLEQTTSPVFKFIVNWCIKYPKAQLKSDFYVEPFSRDLWSAIITCIVIGTMFLIIGPYFLPKNRRKCMVDDIFSVMEYFCCQSGSTEPENISFRIFNLSLSLLSFVLLSSFGAVILSYLAVEIPDIPFVDLKTFRQNGEYRLLVLPLVRFALENDRSLFKSKWGNFTIDYKTEEQLKLICDEKVAFAKIDYSFFMFEIPCNTYLIHKPVGYLWLVLDLSINNPFRNAFNYHLIRFYESGVQNRMQKLLEYRSNDKLYEDQLQGLGLEQLREVLLIPFIGFALGTIIIFGELCINYRNLKSKHRNRLDRTV